MRKLYVSGKRGYPHSMRKIIVFLYLACSLPLPAVDAPKDSIHTRYEKGVFTTQCKVRVNASEETADGVMHDFIRQYRSSLDSLFSWGLKDMNLRGEDDDFIIYYLKSSEYDPASEIIHGRLDVVVPKILAIRDIAVDGKMYVQEQPEKETVVRYDILRASGFIKEAGSVFKITREDACSAWCTLDVRVKFGWFFNLFITQKIYKKNLEQRFAQLAVNLKEEIQRRETAPCAAQPEIQ